MNDDEIDPSFEDNQWARLMLKVAKDILIYFTTFQNKEPPKHVGF